MPSTTSYYSKGKMNNYLYGVEQNKNDWANTVYYKNKKTVEVPMGYGQLNK